MRKLPSFQGCITVFTALAKPPTSQFINASRWYSHIDALLTISGVSAEGSGVIPWDDETDMKKLEEAVRSIQMEELFWGASKLVPIMCTIVDDLVSVDTMIEEQLTVEPINEFVQSCDIVAFNKICKFLNYL
ncbi:hypothetical protein HID58_075189 [Brassica napus]|uniref:Translation elongation factor EF1B beta/delta subunit guanine nucleotide exchange domain-containing protein n=1 Tax=Brassica napus TaxID=3708 RepID=A0ABQ7YKL4_BRANA|nr:hypothetical protein HID58_075189 [Brassica napus]